MTLIELTVCICAILAFILIILVGSRAWRRGGDRASCVLALRNVQVATRSYQNLYGYREGGRPCAEAGSQDIASHLFSKGYIEQDLYDHAKGDLLCPGGGRYSRSAPDVFPQAGELYLKCTLSASDGHEPASHADW